MRLLYLAAIAVLAYLTPSQAQRIATVVVYVTVPPSSTTDAAIVPQSASIDHQQQEDQSTLSSLSSKSEATTSTSWSSPTPTSHVEHKATSSHIYPEVTAAASTASTYYEPGQSRGGVDTEEGASGSDAAAFRLSKGGLAAILIVVIMVSLFGSEYDDPYASRLILTHQTVASIVLFIVAKRRQWTMRQTLTRASRRLTGRFTQPKTPQTASTANRRSRRTGIRMGSPPRPGVKAVYPPGHKRGLVVDVKDPEKGPQPLDGRAPTNTRPRENTWIQRLWGDGWK
jgi:hypothetical protein